LLLHDPWPVSLEVTATTKSGEIMALAHKQWPIWGVQYHPEAILTENGHTLLRNWLKLVYLQL
jgi:anthranilate/para-aminobenzoate synthase component II